MYDTIAGKPLRVLGISTSTKELFDLAKAWILISVAFSLLFKTDETGWLYSFLAAFATVGSAFLIHELSHKLVAQRFKCWAEFRSFDMMLLFAVITAFFGFVFAAPGAVMIRGSIRPEKNGKISLAGPGANIILAVLLGVAYLFSGSFRHIIAFGFFVNAWLAVLNLLPLPSFDGSKVLAWNKVVYFISMVLSFVLLAASYVVFSF